MASVPRLLLVTGKGGVGKTTVATSLAIALAQSGKRVLLCDVEQSGAAATALSSSPWRFAPRQVAGPWASLGGQLWGMSLDTVESLDEYARIHLRVPGLARIPQINRIFDFVATAAPGVRELLTIGKLAYDVKVDAFDVVVADGPASGHGLGQLQAVRAVHGLAAGGPIFNQTKWMIDILTDPAKTQAVIVTTPEELAVAESMELMASLQNEADVRVGVVIANRVFPPRMTTGSTQPAPSGTDDLALCQALRDTQLDYLRQLIDAVQSASPTTTYLSLPELFVDKLTTTDLGHIATELTNELDWHS